MQTRLRHSAASSYLQPAGVEVRPHQQQLCNTAAMPGLRVSTQLLPFLNWHLTQLCWCCICRPRGAEPLARSTTCQAKSTRESGGTTSAMVCVVTPCGPSQLQISVAAAPLCLQAASTVLLLDPIMLPPLQAREW